MPTNWGTLRVPFSAFMATEKDAPRRIEGEDVAALGIKFSPRQQRSKSLASQSKPAKRTEEADIDDLYRRVNDKVDIDELFASGGIESESSGSRFSFMLDYVKATPTGSEPDFILVSCAGAGIDDPEVKAKVAKFKLMGEDALRSSGLGYTVVRPGPLLDEPGGSRALIFDQGDRITQSISCADVADVCLRSLHEPVARNKSFEVCFEYENTAGSMYELVTQVKDAGTSSYLQPALSVLEQNT